MFSIVCEKQYVSQWDAMMVEDFHMDSAAREKWLNFFVTLSNNVCFSNACKKILVVRVCGFVCCFQWSVNSSVDVTLYSGYSATDVYRQWYESGHIVNWILPWKANTVSVSPFNHSCIAVRASEVDCIYDISLIVTRMFAFRLLLLLIYYFYYHSVTD